MKKIIIILTAILFFAPVRVFAATDFEQQINQLAEDYNIPAEQLMDITLQDIIDFAIQQVHDTAKQPLKISAKILALIFVFSAVKALSADNNAALHTIDVVCTLIVFINLLVPIGNVIKIAADNLSSVKSFMTLFLPIFAGISMVSGEFFTSAIYTGFFLTSMVIIADFLLTGIIPSLQLYFSLIISNTLSPLVKLESISDFYVKAVKWIMKSVVSVICFVLTLQTTISQGKDTFAVKAGKFITGAAIPVIGSALQDAVGSVYAGMEAIKGFAGAVGIAGIVMIFIPSIISLVIYWVCTNILHITSELFDIKNISSCLNGFITVIELTISIVFLYMVMLIFSLTIMISITNGV